MSKLIALFRLTFIVLLAGAGLNACTDSDEGRANSAWDKGLAAYKKEDYATALREWQPLAEQGDAEAQGSLGVMYSSGRGVPKDDVYAHMWANIAASGGVEYMVAYQDVVELEMTPSQIAEAQKLARECVRKEYKNC